MTAQKIIDWQGHRGCRGLMPENTIPAFLKAIELGVTTLELDLAVSKDQLLVVSHEPFMSSTICSHPDGRFVTKDEARELNIYEMPYAEVQKYDCGLRPHPRFPGQEKIAAYKPKFSDVVDAVNIFCFERNLKPPAFNIEIKSHQMAYDIYMPGPEVFVGLVVDQIRKLGIESNSTIQSFDVEVLKELEKVRNRSFTIAFLVENEKGLENNLALLPYIPDIYSPYHKLAKKKVIRKCHELGIKVIPWTVNKQKRMVKLIRKGVDGIITDYPDRIINVQ